MNKPIVSRAPGEDISNNGVAMTIEDFVSKHQAAFI
jgi:hypothetical protein